MRMFLISDNVDTAVGMRLAGVDGVVVHEKESVMKKLDELFGCDDIAVVLITPIIGGLISQELDEIKLKRKLPLICEIPDRHVDTDVTASIARYVREAIGIRIDE